MLSPNSHMGLRWPIILYVWCLLLHSWEVRNAAIP